jgi:hypothetical protein
LVERTAPRRILRVEAREDGLLNVGIILDESLVKLTQQSDGRIQWLSGPLADITDRSAGNFAALFRDQLEAVERDLWPWLRAFGVVTPLSSDSAAVRSIVLDQLKGLTPESRQTAERLIAQLDAVRFDERQSAFRQLQSQLPTFYQMIHESLRRDNLSPEARARLDELARHAWEAYGEALTLADILDLVDRPDYLRALAARSESESETRALIDARLKSLETGE